MKKKITLKTADFKKVYTQLKKLESKGDIFKINGLSLSGFLIASATFDDHDDTPEIRTKRIILQIAGNSSVKPENLPDHIKLGLNLLYGDNEYSLLQMRLNALVKTYNTKESVSDNETSDCVTVGDCTVLVNSKINPS